MATSLYQKYRPKFFAELIGQEHIRKTLLNEMCQHSVAHAYIFSGPRGIGKTTTARILARAVNCVQPINGEPCNSCTHCMSIAKGKALDVIEIDAASHTGVDHVREHIIENARVAPSHFSKKVFIIDEVHMLSISAFNALLKTLEEPPKNTLFILATTEIHKVPATIVSRCERFTFRRISFIDMKQRLQDLAKQENMLVDEEVIHAIVQRSEGALRDAESFLGQVMALDKTHITKEIAEIILPHSNVSEMVSLWEEMVRADTANALTRIHQLGEEGVLFIEFFKGYVEFLRRLLLSMVQKNNAPLEYFPMSEDEQQRVQHTIQQSKMQDVAQVLELFMQAIEQSKNSAIPQLPFELAIVQSSLLRNVSKEDASTHSLQSHKKIQNARSISSEKLAQRVPKKDQPKKQENDNAKIQSSASIDLQLADVQKHWATLLEEMNHQNHALHLTFQVGKIVAVAGNTITLGFQYQFYQDRLQDARNRPVIEAVFQKVFGQPVQLEVLVGKEFAAKPTAAAENIEQPSEDEVENIWDLASKAFSVSKPKQEES